MKIDNKFQFEDRYDNEDFNTTIFWITAPCDILEEEYIDAEFATISIEIPMDDFCAEKATVLVSPTKFDGENGYCDYDWREMGLSIEDTQKLIDICLKGYQKG